MIAAHTMGSWCSPQMGLQDRFYLPPLAELLQGFGLGDVDQIAGGL